MIVGVSQIDENRAATGSFHLSLTDFTFLQLKMALKHVTSFLNKIIFMRCMYLYRSLQENEDLEQIEKK